MKNITGHPSCSEYNAVLVRRETPSITPWFHIHSEMSINILWFRVLYSFMLLLCWMKISRFTNFLFFTQYHPTIELNELFFYYFIKQCVPNLHKTPNILISPARDDFGTSQSPDSNNKIIDEMKMHMIMIMVTILCNYVLACDAAFNSCLYEKTALKQRQQNIS